MPARLAGCTAVFIVPFLVAGCGTTAPLRGNGISAYGDAPSIGDNVHAKSTRSFNPFGDVEPQHSIAGAPQLVYRMDRIHVPRLIEHVSNKIPGDKDSALKEVNLEEAIGLFYRETRTAVLADRRNRIQDALMMASEHRCNVYKLYLKNTDVSNRSFFGSASTIFAGAGAIATGTVNTRAFAGLSAMFGGVGAQVSQDLFLSLATYVIVPGIDMARDNIKAKLADQRSKDISGYTLEAALADAARYHGACSLDTGLNHVAEKISDSKDVGIKRATEILGYFSQAQQKMQLIAETQRVARTAIGESGVGQALAPVGLAQGNPAALGLLAARLLALETEASASLDIAEDNVKETKRALTSYVRRLCETHKLAVVNLDLERPEQSECLQRIRSKIDDAIRHEEDSRKKAALLEDASRLTDALAYFGLVKDAVVDLASVRADLIDARLADLTARNALTAIATGLVQMAARNQVTPNADLRAQILAAHAELDGKLGKLAALSQSIVDQAQKVSRHDERSLTPSTPRETESAFNALKNLCSKGDTGKNSCPDKQEPKKSQT
jgi:hypothetical protein